MLLSASLPCLLLFACPDYTRQAGREQCVVNMAAMQSERYSDYPGWGIVLLRTQQHSRSNRDENNLRALDRRNLSDGCQPSTRVAINDGHGSQAGSVGVCRDHRARTQGGARVHLASAAGSPARAARCPRHGPPLGSHGLPLDANHIR